MPVLKILKVISASKNKWRHKRFYFFCFLFFAYHASISVFCCNADTLSNCAEWFAFIGKRAAPSLPGSPYAITFKSAAPESSGMTPMNVSTYACGDIALGCSCGDCPSSSVCTNTAPPPEHKEGSCSVRLGSLEVRTRQI